MPYVPTNDRPLIYAAVERAANQIVANVGTNFSLLVSYKNLFHSVGNDLCVAAHGEGDPHSDLARTIWDAAAKYGHEGAFLGELNYAITRLIQRVPQLMVADRRWAPKDELRYWLYAVTVESLIYTAAYFTGSGCGVGGVFEDIKDEYKRRVNTSYEGAQIEKSGDCYDTPYYNRLMRIVDRDGNEIGKFLVDMSRSEATLHKDILDTTLTAY
jgi:hypothetical protein